MVLDLIILSCLEFTDTTEDADNQELRKRVTMASHLQDSKVDALIQHVGKCLLFVLMFFMLHDRIFVACD